MEVTAQDWRLCQHISTNRQHRRTGASELAQILSRRQKSHRMRNPLPSTHPRWGSRVRTGESASTLQPTGNINTQVPTNSLRCFLDVRNLTARINHHHQHTLDGGHGSGLPVHGQPAELGDASSQLLKQHISHSALRVRSRALHSSPNTLRRRPCGDHRTQPSPI